MKKNIFLLSVFILAVGCSTRKNKFVNRAYHNFTAYYNTLFHGKEALKAELKSQKESYRDNFQEGYIEVFQPLYLLSIWNSLESYVFRLVVEVSTFIILTSN